MVSWRASRKNPGATGHIRSASEITDHNRTERTTAIRTQLQNRGVAPALQRIRMNLEQDNAVPLNAVVAKQLSHDPEPTMAEPDMELDRNQHDLGR
ncbi:hypothetical protein [Nocardia panacis]|uniref:hypothetical protein n=1 Tax=Nocardia panacis TaxID=2340916 RepID=UPI001EEFF1F6|nr:hypothetical protein [Nocardia panacis]